jgi:cell division transport system ATP-binding protein
MTNESYNIININGIDIYQIDKLILKDVSFEVKNGEFVYLIGKTGSGKSSLLKVLYGDIKIKEGNAEVLDYEIKKIKKRKILSLRRRLGIIFQDFQLLMDRSVNDNLLFVMKATGWKGKKKMNAKINELLSKVGMESKGNQFPHQLSGGEQQRIAIARALINDPDLILADEPTGNLDPETSEEIIRLLFEISNNNKTIIMATHDYDLIKKYPARTIKCVDSLVHDNSIAN